MNHIINNIALETITSASPISVEHIYNETWMSCERETLSLEAPRRLINLAKKGAVVRETNACDIIIELDGEDYAAEDTVADYLNQNSSRKIRKLPSECWEYIAAYRDGRINHRP